MDRPSLPVDPRPSTHRKGDGTIRRLLFGLPLALIALALIVPASPAAAGIRKVTLGVTIEHHNRERSTFQTFERKVGNTPRIWTLWSQWGSRYGQQDCVPDLGTSTCGFPTAAANWVAAEGAVPMIFWEPVRAGASDPCEFSDHRRIANGAHDDYIRQWAKAAKAYGRPVLVRFAHEINGAYFYWGLKNSGKGAVCQDTAADFIRGWRHIVGIFDDVGATRVRFVWSISKSTCPPRSCSNPYKAYYPGNSYVDYVGFSNFNWGSHSGRTWTSMLSGVSDVMVYLRTFTKKPAIIAENASNTDGGSKPKWIKSGYEAVYRRWPQIKAIVYLNVNLTSIGHPDWSLNSPGPYTASTSASHRAYERVADQRRFRGRIR